MMTEEKLNFEEVSKSEPCPICGKPDWCTTDEEKKYVCCRRESGAEAKLKYDKNGAEYYVHYLGGAGDSGISYDFEESRSRSPKEENKPELAEVRTRNEVYKELLYYLDLEKSHEVDLIERGFNVHQIEKNEYKSIKPGKRKDLIEKLLKHHDKKRLLKVPGFYQDESGEIKMLWCRGLLIPCRNNAGEIHALRVRNYDKQGPKYYYLSSEKKGGPELDLEVHVSLDSSREFSMRSTNRVLNITEGELKADFVNFYGGLPGLTISVPGVSTWELAKPVINTLDPEKIMICFDMDAVLKRHVSEALLKCFLSLVESYGKSKVGIYVWDVAEGKGIDDYFLKKSETVDSHLPEKISGDKAFSTILGFMEKSGALKGNHKNKLILEYLNIQAGDEIEKEFIFNEDTMRALAFEAINNSVEFESLKEKVTQEINHNTFVNLVNEKKEEIKKETREEKESEILEKIGIEVLGCNKNDEVFLFFQQNRIKKINRIDDFTYNDGLLLAGSKFEQNISPHRGDEKIAITRFKNIIALKASGSLIPAKKLGQGIHKLDENILVVSGVEAALINPSTQSIEKIESPIYKNCFLGFRAGEEWVDFDELPEIFEKMTDSKNRKKAIKKLVDIISQWSWKNPEVDPILIAGGLLASVIQGVWNWRPHYAYVGPAGTGKSTFFKDLFSPLMGNLLPRVFDTGSTEAGIRQSLLDPDTDAASMKIIIRDEFEQIRGRKREKIMEWIRAGNKGGYTTKGTPGQKEVLEFQVKHSFHVGSVEFGGMATEADWSRFLRFYLTAQTDKEMGELKIPGNKELQELGKNLIALAIRSAAEVNKRVDNSVKKSETECATRRMKQNHAVPLAILKEALPDDDYVPDLDDVLDKRIKEVSFDTDAEKLLEHILSQQIYDDLKTMRRVSYLIRNNCGEELEANGIKIVVTKSGEKKLFFHPDAVSQYLVNIEKFSAKNIRDYLLQLTDAEPDRQRIDGQLLRGVSIPMKQLYEKEGDDLQDENIKDSAIDQEQVPPHEEKPLGKDEDVPSPQKVLEGVVV